MNFPKIVVWFNQISAAEAFLAKYSDLFHVESPVIQEMHNLMTALTESVSESIGDELKSLEWFWLENNLGKSVLKAGGADGVLREISTVDDLAWLLGVTAP